MNGNEQGQFLIFFKYTRPYLHWATDISKGHLSRIASGAREPGEAVKSRCAEKLGESVAVLFRRVKPQEESEELAHPRQPYQDLIDTIDELASRLTKTEARLKTLEHEFNKYG